MPLLLNEGRAAKNGSKDGIFALYKNIWTTGLRLRGSVPPLVPPPHHNIGRPHVFPNLTSLELPAAALGGIGVHKNYDLFGIVDNLEFQNVIILLHQEDKEDTNRLVPKLPKNLMSKTLQ